LQQSGILPFHYSILPHGSYDPALANRFGLRQTHPLVAVPCIENPIKKPILNIDNPRVFISAIKPSEDGTAMILRLRSVSPEAETVHLDWPGGAPKSIHFCLADEVPGEITEQPILIAPYGALGLRLQFK
jgi:alpha-mannosidase